MPDRLIRITTALAVATVAAVAAVISYRHAYELVSSHGESGLTARLVPFTVDGLILAASMLILDASKQNQPVPPLARWCLGAGIVATIGANLAHGLGHGPIGALVSAWPALALAGSFELLMRQVRRAAEVGTSSQRSAEVRGRSAGASSAGRPSVSRPAAGERPGGRGRDVQVLAWQWALANRCGDGSLPSGRDIGDQHGRHGLSERLLEDSVAATLTVLGIGIIRRFQPTDPQIRSAA